jgi:hypothetical protein
MATRTLPVDVVKGVIAGAIATWAMGKVTTWIYDRQAPETREAEKAGWQDGRPAYEIAAHTVNRALSLRLDEPRERRLASAMHWALGMKAAAVYALVRPALAPRARARGVTFGLTVFVVFDEIANWLFGFSKAPTAFPWQTHARGFAGHVAYGLATEAVLDALDRATPGRRRALTSRT